MLAGGYSKQYQTLEKEHLDNLKSTTYNTKIDVLTRAKKLSQETNKRRKAQAIKRKTEAIKEEKRRKEILAKRHEEQRVATERFQRSHIQNSRPNSSKSFKYSSTIDDALKLVRGSPPASRQTSFVHHGGRTSPLPAGNYPSDPLNRPYFNRHKSRHLSPSSPPSPRSQEHAEMMDKSLRNWNDSKSLFEQQLEQHQLLLLDQQQKSLYEFNEAISNEIAADDKVNGIEDRDDVLNIQSESVSSVDSLEDSLNAKNKPQEEINDANLLAHNLFYPVSSGSGSGAKGSFYLQTNYMDPCNKTESQSSTTRSQIPHSSSDIQVHSTPSQYHYMSQSNSTIPVTDTNKPMFVLTGNLLQANTTPVNATIYQYRDDMERPTSHIKTWVDRETMETNNTHRNNMKTSTTPTATSYNITTPQVKPRTIFNTNNTVDNTVNSTSINTYGTTTSGISKITSNSVSICPVTNSVTNTKVQQTVSKCNVVNATSVTPSKNSNDTEINKPLEGSLLTGTLNLINGKLVANTDDRPKFQSKFPASYTPPEETTSYCRPVSFGSLTRAESVDNIVGILKKSPSSNSIKTSDMRDSVEIIKLKRQMSEDTKLRPKSGKKSVRFADLSDEEETDIFMSSFNGHDSKAHNLRNSKGSKFRPSSARVISKMAKVPPSAPKPTRASSAGTSRSTSKPKAVAHRIIQEQHLTDQAEAYYKHLQANLENKVTVVNNNFMTKVATTQITQVEKPTNNLVQTYNSKHLSNGTPVQLKLTDASRQITVPTSSTSPPQSSHPYNNLPVFDENGLRLDRTPTDDEINMLWETMRTCLHPDDEEKSQSSHAQSDSVLMSRQRVHVASTIIDGGALGTVVHPARVGSAYQQRTASKSYKVRQAPQTTPNGYLKKYGLLQQRRQHEKTNNQTTESKRENLMPQISQSNTSPIKKAEVVSDSMSMFMMAEQLANQVKPENHILQAMDDLQTKQDMTYPKNKVPSALSIEEQQLIESLDRINDKLKSAENKYPHINHHTSQHSTTTISNTTQPTPGFRGRRPITAHQRRHTDSVRTDYLIRAASAHTSSSQRQYR